MALSSVLLANDQVTKFLAGWLLVPTTTEQWNECYPMGVDCAARLADVRIAFNWGLTYTEHAGFWLWGDLRGSVAVVLFVVVLAVWAGVLVAARGYRRWYRSSLAVDLAAAWVTLAVWGHLTDRLLFGAARDWLVTPIGVANLPDMAVWPALLLCAIELWRYPPARRLLHPDPRRWRPPAPTAIRRPTPRARCTGVPGWTRPAARAPTVAGPTKRLLVTGPTPALRRNNRIAAVFMLVAAGMAGVAATGTRPVVFVALVLVFTVAALSFALRGRFGAR